MQARKAAEAEGEKLGGPTEPLGNPTNADNRFGASYPKNSEIVGEKDEPVTAKATATEDKGGIMSNEMRAQEEARYARQREAYAKRNPKTPSGLNYTQPQTTLLGGAKKEESGEYAHVVNQLSDFDWGKELGLDVPDIEGLPATRAVSVTKDGIKAGTDYDYSSNIKSGGLDYQSRFGIDRPTPAPSSVLGSKDYYSWRAMDFQKRNPGKEVPDYYTDYGDKYANIFADEVYQNVSNKGKQWVSNTMRELQNKMEIALFDDPSLENDPDRLKDFAFESHSDAYIEGGLFDLDGEDWKSIAKAVDLEDALSGRAIKEYGDILLDGADKLADYLSKQIQNLPKALREKLMSIAQ